MSETSFLTAAAVSPSEPTPKGLSERLVKALTQDEFILFAQAIMPLSPKGDEALFQEILIVLACGVQ